MVKEKFNSVSQLYMKVLPALRSRKKELEIKKLGFIKEKDIWDYLKKTKWKNEKNLTLFDIVNDILTVEEDVLLEFMNSTL